MKRNILLLSALLVVANLFFASCGGDGKNSENKDTLEAKVVDKVVHTQLLLEKIVANGDFINTKYVPTLVDAADVKQNIGKYFVIDLRDAKAFSEGHIKGAVNVKFEDLFNYMKYNETKDYPKVILVCYTGQTASYAASLLQINGYDNVWGMKWGMASWNKKFAEKWLKGVSNKYAEQLETTSNPKGKKTVLPKFDCVEKDPAKILEMRTSKVFKDGFSNVLVSVEDVFANPEDYYIINYWPADLYETGHLKGAVQYTPKSSLSEKADLLTLPTDKKIVTYCFTGQHSAFVTAYLRLLGYDAYSIKFGSNSFMNQTMIDKTEFGHGFSPKQINNFEYETSKYDGSADAGNSGGGC